MTLLALLSSITLGTASLVWGYVGVGLPHLARWVALLGAVWLLAAWRRWRWFAYVGLAAYFLAAILGLLKCLRCPKCGQEENDGRMK